MRHKLRHPAAVLSFAFASLILPATTATSAPVIAVPGPPFEFIDTFESSSTRGAGGESAPALAPWDYNGGFLATWINYRSAADRRTYISFYSQYGTQIYPVSRMGAPTGPTAGVPSFSAGPVNFANGKSLVLFSADRRGALAANKRDIFAQKMGSGPWEPVGTPLGVNTLLPNSQDTLVVTRLSTANALTAFVTHATAASTFDIKGRVINFNAAGVTPEKALTVNTAGLQRPMGLAALTTGGRSVLSYVVQTGSTQQVYLQRLDALATRTGNPVLLKTTTGASYGGAGVAALSGGRFIAMWFVPGTGGTAILKGRFFSATGAATGALLTIATTRIPAAMLQTPKIAVAPDGQLMVVTVGLTGTTYSMNAWYLTAAGVRQTGPTKLASSTKAMTPESLIRLPSGYYVASWTEAATTPTATRALGVRFNIFSCGRC